MIKIPVSSGGARASAAARAISALAGVATHEGAGPASANASARTAQGRKAASATKHGQGLPPTAQSLSNCFWIAASGSGLVTKTPTSRF